MAQTDIHNTARKSLPILRAIRDSKPPLISPRLRDKIKQLYEEYSSLRASAPDLPDKLIQSLKTEYTYNTVALEGNTLTLSETQLVVEYGMTVAGKSVKEHLEAANIPKALYSVLNLAKRRKKRPLTEQDILSLHSLTTYGIREAEPGKFRSGYVRIAGSTFVPPPAYEVKFLIQEMARALNSNQNNLNVVELAFQAHLWLVSIHPFIDGNGRVARLLAGLILLRNGYPPIIIRKEHRIRYISVIKNAQTVVNLKPYYNFMAQEFISTLATYVASAKQRSKGDEVVPLSIAAKEQGLDPEYLGLLARIGEIPAIKVGSRWHVRAKDLKSYLEKRRRRKILNE